MSGIQQARVGLKAIAILFGSVLTFSSLAALAGALVESGLLRGAFAIVAGIGAPLVLADRLLPKSDVTGSKGLVSDVFAIFFLLVPFLMAGPLGTKTAGLFVREGDREWTAGFSSGARIAYFLGGVRVSGEPQERTKTDEPKPEPSAAGSTAPLIGSSTTSASGLPPALVPERDRGKERTPAEIFRDLAPSVVSIRVSGRGEGSGTGFFVDGDGTIATNAHVIEGATRASVRLFSGRTVEDVEILAEDTALDLALIKIALTDIPKVTTLGDSDRVTVGEHVVSIGNPLGLDYTLTDGLISARRIFEGRPMLQMSVPVSPGNSGGPVFDMHGEVVGITTLQVLGDVFGRAQNLNMAGPVNALKSLMRPPYPRRRKLSGTW